MNTALARHFAAGVDFQVAKFSRRAEHNLQQANGSADDRGRYRFARRQVIARIDDASRNRSFI
jgi:hypothetical protein